jgi:hypothetical protein
MKTPFSSAFHSLSMLEPFPGWVFVRKELVIIEVPVRSPIDPQQDIHQIDIAVSDRDAKTKR